MLMTEDAVISLLVAPHNVGSGARGGQTGGGRIQHQTQPATDPPQKAERRPPWRPPAPPAAAAHPKHGSFHLKAGHQTLHASIWQLSTEPAAPPPLKGGIWGQGGVFMAPSTSLCPQPHPPLSTQLSTRGCSHPTPHRQTLPGENIHRSPFTQPRFHPKVQH